ncbi:L-asparaginase-like protein GL17509 [Scaptodrosophila lebanonensis]|uniref:L-asparaginase-like protein GL17509 n=1 Tax=Drosophila lebanonensis TaxID=7225 RepID=A0A6J2TG08_DROLE|nr:L-asparaginase-like protein GL17509 [Scaptodrosophila lebanonensis]
MVINTWNYTKPNLHAWHVLNAKPGGLNLTREAVVQGCSMCEHQQCGRLLGRGSAPDASGHITLEAALMDGSNLRLGSVAAMPDIRDAIGVARQVLEHTKHTLLAGAGATRFAKALGHTAERLSSPVTVDALYRWQHDRCQPNYWQNVRPPPFSSCGPYMRVPQPKTGAYSWPRQEYPIEIGHHDQIAMLAIDAKGHMHVGSTSTGSAFRIAGRAGDSAVPGAGIYADNEVGAALVSGDGDVMMRLLPALLAVETLRAGRKPSDTAVHVLHRLLHHHTEFNGGLVVVNRLGQYAAACSGLDEFHFVVSHQKNQTLARVERVECIDRREFVDGGPKGTFKSKATSGHTNLS